MTPVTEGEVHAWTHVFMVALKDLSAQMPGFDELTRLEQHAAAAFSADDATKAVNAFAGVPSEIAQSWAYHQKLDLAEFKLAYNAFAKNVTEDAPGGGGRA